MNNREKFKKVFWGLHTDMHANAYDTVRCRDLNADYLEKLLRTINPDFVQCDCKGHPGYTSYPTEVGTVSPGLVNDNLKIWREATNRLGIMLLMHYSGVIDTKAVEDHPEWKIVDVNGDAVTPWGMGVTCPNSDYDDVIMIPQMIEIVKKYDVDGFWVDGENWAVNLCYCEKCKKKFKEEYGLEAPKDETSNAWDKWTEYTRKNFERHLDKYTKAVHAVKPDCMICSNWAYTLRQPDAVNTDVDYLSGDFWTVERANCETRVMENQGRIWNLMLWGFSKVDGIGASMKTTDAFCQNAAVVMSRGGAVMSYQTPTETGVFSDNEFERLAQLEKFIRARQEYCQDTEIYPQIAVLHAKESYYKKNVPVYQVGPNGTTSVEGAVNLSLASGFETTVLLSERLEEQGDSFTVIIVPEQINLSDKTVEYLKKYSENGGNLIISGAETVKYFADCIGIDPNAELVNGFIPVDEYTVPGMDFLKVKSDNAIKRFIFNKLGEKYENTKEKYASVIRVNYGNGSITAILGNFYYNAQKTRYAGYRTLQEELVTSLNDSRLIKIDAPAYIQPSVRTKDNKTIVTFVNIASDYPLYSDNGYIENIPYAGPVTVEYKRKSKPGKIYFAPTMDPVDYSFKDGVLKVKIRQVHIMDFLVIED